MKKKMVTVSRMNFSGETIELPFSVEVDARLGEDAFVKVAILKELELIHKEIGALKTKLLGE